MCKNCSKSGLTIVPRVGAFEVKFRDKTLFSKLNSGSWPQADSVAQRIAEHLQRPHTRSDPKLQSPSKKMFKTEQKKKKTHRKTLSSPTSPLCFGSHTAVKSPYSSTPPSALSSRGFASSSRLARPIGLSLEDTDVSIDPVSKFKDNYVYSLAAELQKGRDQGAPHPLRPVTLSCEVAASANYPTSHAIEYKNKGAKQARFLLISSHTGIMRVRRAMVVVPSGAKGLFELELDSGGRTGERTLYLYVDREGAPWECIEVNVDFQDL